MQTTDFFMKSKCVGLLFMASALTGCGGGGGDGDDIPPPQPGPPVEQALPSVVGGKATLLAGSLNGECGAVNDGGAITFHKGEIWLADAPCDGGARVQAINAITGEVRAIAKAAKAFRFPTGIAVDSHETPFVMDGWITASKWPWGFILPSPTPGSAAGIWKVSGNGMSIFAGVVPTSAVDGVGDKAGFHLPNGLAIDAGDNLYTQDDNKIRRITPDAVVTSIENVGISPPVSDYDRQHVYSVRSSPGNIGQLYDFHSGDLHVTLPNKGNIVAFDPAGNLYSAKLADSPASTEPVVIYRRLAGNTQFEPIVTQVQYLNAATIDDNGNLYLYQRNAIVKVEFLN